MTTSLERAANISGKVRIGILGCAKIARRSMAPAIKQLADRFELVAVASRDAATADAFADEFACEAVTGYESLVARSDIDALYVPLPTGIHAHWIGQAIAAGKHVYAEKSFASNLTQSADLVNAAKLASVALMEGYMFLYHRQQTVVADCLREGAIGEMRHFHASFGFPPLPADDFRFDEVLGGGALLDAAGYPLRAVSHFLGPGLQVQAATLRRSAAGTSLWGSAFLANNHGVGASIAFGFDNFYQCRCEFWGSKGKLTAERAFTPGPGFKPRLLLETEGNVIEQLVDADNHFVGALNEFAHAISDAECRHRHYDQILVQSRALGRIRELADIATVKAAGP